MQLANTASLALSSANISGIQTSGTQKGSKLHEAAQQFEALMMEEMLKVTRETSSEGWLGSGDGTGDDSAMDMAQSQLAQALSKSGGMGLAKTIETQLAPRVNQTTESSAQGSGSTQDSAASSTSRTF